MTAFRRQCIQLLVLEESLTMRTSMKLCLTMWQFIIRRYRQSRSSKCIGTKQRKRIRNHLQRLPGTRKTRQKQQRPLRIRKIHRKQQHPLRIRKIHRKQQHPPRIQMLPQCQMCREIR